jgi:alcohol dehydrogenase class IV/choline kinase
MKAFIFNSGAGTRMGDLTKDNPKALVNLSNGETLLSRQLRLIKQSGIKQVVISTGPFEEKIKKITSNYPSLEFKFINNSLYKTTNSIYSMYLAKDYFDDDFIIMHGDLVFDAKLLPTILKDPINDIALINKTIPKPEKDFKGRIINNVLKEISVHIFDRNCFALQPLYKLSKHTISLWLQSIEHFIDKNLFNVYAEEAMNRITESLHIGTFDYEHHFIEEVDNIEDLHRVSKDIRRFDYQHQTIIYSDQYLFEILNFIQDRNIKRPLLVIGKSVLNNKFISLDTFNEEDFIIFSAYSSNPTYEQVLNGLSVFNLNQCDGIIAVGGGSCIDVAKAIKLLSGSNIPNVETYTYVDIPLFALPTTAGTGTESTRFSVIYNKGIKQSLTHDCLLPDVAVLDSNFLKSLPEYHKKTSLLDAFCQAIESLWSVHSNDVSKNYAKQSLSLFLKHYEGYLNGDIRAFQSILKASNLAGRAINISQTTAPHALSYVLTSKYNIAHGHAVSLLLPEVLHYMMGHLDKCIDPRGEDYFLSNLKELSAVFEVNDVESLLRKIIDIINFFKLDIPKILVHEIKEFTIQVNQTRLSNNPIHLDQSVIEEIYKKSFNLN